MAKGTPNALRLEVMNALIQKMPVAQENRFLNIFGSTSYESDTIRN